VNVIMGSGTVCSKNICVRGIHMSFCSDQFVCLCTKKHLVDVSVCPLTSLVLTPRNKSLVHKLGTAILFNFVLKSARSLISLFTSTGLQI
jgi:hypothetical protein